MPARRRRATYFINYFGHYGGKLQDDKGNHPPPGAKVPASMPCSTRCAWYITNTKILGANWGVHAILPVVNQSICPR